MPLSIATDDHQRLNAEAIVQNGGGWLMLESEFTPANLAKRLIRLFSKPNELRAAAKASLKMAKPGATEQLAEIVELPLPKIKQPEKAKPKPTATKGRAKNIKARGVQA